MIPQRRCPTLQKLSIYKNGIVLFHPITNLPNTCGGICLQLLDRVIDKQNLVFPIDSYHKNSIKDQERLCRGYSLKYIMRGPATRKPIDFNLFFLANEENRQQLCQPLLRAWQNKEATSCLEKCETAVVIVKVKSYQLSSSDCKVSIYGRSG